MRLNAIRTILNKELREILRDKRSLFMMAVLPVLMYPLLIITLTRLQDSEERASEARRSRIAVWGSAPASLLDALKDKQVDLRVGQGQPANIDQKFVSGEFTAIEPPAESDNQQREQIRQHENHPLVVAARDYVLTRKVDAVLVVYPSLERGLTEKGEGNVAILYDSVRTDSGTARARLQELLRDYRKQTVAQREKEIGAKRGFSNVVIVGEANVAPRARRQGFGMGMVLPFLLIFTSVSGALMVAVDTTAGEKERNTLQTLIAAPLRPEEIAIAKFLSVWVIGLIMATINVASMGATFSAVSRGAGGGMQVSPDKFALSLLMLVPITMLSAAVFTAIGAFARDPKDANNYITPAYMVIGLPSSLAMIPGIELTQWNVFAPVLNIALLIKALLTGEARTDMMFLALLSSFAYAMLAVLLAARIFARENLLVGGTDTWSGVFGLEKGKSRTPSVSLAIALFAVVLVAQFYGQTALASQSFPLLISVSQLGLMLAPALLAIQAFGFDWRETLGLRLPHWRALAGGLLLGVSTWIIAGYIGNALIPVPEGFAQAMRKVLMMEGQDPPLWLLILLIAGLPALCEEVLFRGFIQRGLLRMGTWPALILTAFLFGLAHASIYRMIPTFLIGLALCYAAWRSGSILTSMLVHFVNNSLVAILATNPQLLKPLGVSPDQMNLPLVVVLAALPVVALGVLLLRSVPGPKGTDMEARSTDSVGGSAAVFRT